MTTRPSSADELRGLVLAALHEKGVSQAEAARRLGLSAKHVSHMMTGKAPLTIEWADRILALCGKRLALRTVTARRRGADLS